MYWHSIYLEQFEQFAARGSTERCCPFGEWAKGRSLFYAFMLLIKDPRLVRRIEVIQERLRPFPFVSLPPAHFLHVTLKPLGYWDETKSWDDSLDQDDLGRWVEQAATTAVNQRPFTVKLGGVNSWANSAFVEIYDLQGGLSALLEALDARFIETGRLRVPHVTVGYYTARAPARALVEVLSTLRSFEVGELQVGSFELVSAEASEGLTYQPLEAVQTFRLRGSGIAEPLSDTESSEGWSDG
jgi:2'-5' RNA ligase